MTAPESNGRSTVYVIGDWAAVNNGPPHVDDAGCWWKATREEGWSGAPVMNANVVKWPTRDGQASSSLRLDPRTPLLGGTVWAPDQARLQAAIDQASALLSGPVRTDTLEVREPHLTRRITVRRDQEADVAKVSPFTATWLFPLVADDPRRLGDPLIGSTGLPSVSGGLTIPFTVPFSLGATVVAGSIALANPGTLRGPLRLRIAGPVTDPRVIHVNAAGVAKTLALSITLATGEWLDIDPTPDVQSVLINGTTSRAGDLTSRQWFGFEPGVNTFAFGAASSDPAAVLTVTGFPAW